MSNDLFDVSELSEAAVNEANSTNIIPCPYRDWETGVRIVTGKQIGRAHV